MALESSLVFNTVQGQLTISVGNFTFGFIVVAPFRQNLKRSDVIIDVIRNHFRAPLKYSSEVISIEVLLCLSPKSRENL